MPIAQRSGCGPKRPSPSPPARAIRFRNGSLMAGSRPCSCARADEPQRESALAGVAAHLAVGEIDEPRVEVVVGARANRPERLRRRLGERLDVDARLLLRGLVD